MKHIVTIAFAISLLIGTQFAHAQGLRNSADTLDTITAGAGIDDFENVEDVVGVSINAALGLIGLIFFALMIYAGFTWMSARGEEDKIQKAQKIIISSLVGLFIVVAAYAITALVSARFS